MDVIGIDVGFGFTKATNGVNATIFKSLIGDSTEIQFQSSLKSAGNTENLHITFDGKSYFIGSYAEKQSNVRQFTLDQETLLTEFIKLLALTAAGKCGGDTPSVNLVSGLPVGYLKRDCKRVTQMLKGHHKITFHGEEGASATRNIIVQKVQMLPQPIGTVFNLLMDDNGKVVNNDLAIQKVGVIDIGFRTTDFTIFDRLQYVERGSSTMDTGISKCFTIIANKLRQESGVNVELYRLYEAVSSGMIKVRGKEYNIASLRDKVYTHTAQAIANDVNRLWSEDWDIDTVILTGGGAMELGKHISPLIDGHVTELQGNSDARLANVQGYLKFGKYKWGKNAPSAPAPEKDRAAETLAQRENRGQESDEEGEPDPKKRKWLGR